MSAQFKAPWRFCVESAMTNPPKPLGLTIVSADGYFLCSMPLGREDVACVMAAAPELLAALIWREQFEPREGEDSNDRFERVAETFHRDTGYLRPGKDCRINSTEDRQAAWDAWMEVGRARVRAAITKATGAAS